MAIGIRVSVLAVVLLSSLAAKAESVQLAAAESAVPTEQAHLDAVSSRYGVEIADDENLPLSLRSTTAPQSAQLIKLSW